MRIVAIDPGTIESGLVVYDPSLARPILEAEVVSNEQLRKWLHDAASLDSQQEHLAVEMMACYGLAVGKAVFETCVWIGRFIEAWGGPFHLIYRQKVKSLLCNSQRAKDKNIRQALIDKFGPMGRKKEPGLTYGLKGHLWSALAVGVTCAEENLGLVWTRGGEPETA